MKKITLLTMLFFFFLAACYAQEETEFITEEFTLDLSEPAPELVWLSPAPTDSVLKSKELILKAGIKSSVGVKRFKITVNGLGVQGSRGFKPSATGEYARIIEEPLLLNEGGNLVRVEIEDYNEEISRFERTLIVQLADPVIVRNDYALLFATDEYDEWGDLVNPVFDAQAIATELRDNYGFTIEVIENPTQDEIVLKLREYSQKSFLEHDQLFIFFAGHGHFDELFGQGYLVTKNSKINDPSYSTYISHDKLRTIIDNIPAKHILLTMDVCFGGTFDPLIARAGNRGMDLYNGLSNEEFIKRRLKLKTRKYVTSGGKAYVADGIAGHHSPFAAKFLEGLRSYGGNDEIITTQELYLYLERLVPEPKAGDFGTNEPGSDFLFIFKK